MADRPARSVRTAAATAVAELRAKLPALRSGELSFAAVALAMVMTRGEDWSGRGEMAPAPEPA